MVDNREVYIYVLKHPDTLEIRYVGNWILSILKEGKRPIIELLETCQSDNWQEREQYWISKFPNLINLTAGGDGCIGFIHNSETIEKIRQAKLGTKHSIEFKEAMSKRLKGIPLSEEHKSKIGLANKGIKQSEESKRKRSESIKLWWAKRKSIEDIVKS